jgi:predicted Zn-dependent protease
MILDILRAGRIRRRIEQATGYDFEIVLKDFFPGVAEILILGMNTTPTIFFDKTRFKRMTDDQVAGIIAHEIGHLIDRSGFETSRILHQGLCKALDALERSDYPDISPDKYVSLGFIMADIIYNSHQRELQADNASIAILDRAGYNPAGLLEALGIILLEGDIISSTDRGHPSIMIRIKILRESIDLYLKNKKQG